MNLIVLQHLADAAPGETTVDLPLTDERAIHALEVLDLAEDATVRVGIIDGPIVDAKAQWLSGPRDETGELILEKDLTVLIDRGDHILPSMITRLMEKNEVQIMSRRVGRDYGRRTTHPRSKVIASRVALRLTYDISKPVRTQIVPRIHLLLCCPRPKVLEKLFAALVPLGIASVTLLKGDKVEGTYLDSPKICGEASVRAKLIDGIAQAACYTTLPKVTVVRRPSASTVLRKPQLPEDAVKIVCDEAEDGARLRTVLAAAPELAAAGLQTAPIYIAFGSEGGWSEEERAALKEGGFRAAGLGSRIMRTAEAIMCAAGVVNDWLAEQGVAT